MKVLVATRQTQGSQLGDYSWTVEGELVTPVTVECCSAHLCGCGRGFAGLGSDRVTTTAVVVELPDLHPSMLCSAIHDSLDRAGWLEHLDEDEVDEIIQEHLTCIDVICHAFPVGEVLSRWGTQVYGRPEPAAAGTG